MVYFYKTKKKNQYSTKENAFLYKMGAETWNKKGMRKGACYRIHPVSNAYQVLKIL